MRVVSPSFEILTPIDADEALKLIENVGRTCYKSEDKITEESALPFVSGIIKRGHEAVIEHHSFIFELSNTSYTKLRGSILLLERCGFNSFIRFTSTNRHVVSANVRAWRDFFKACLDNDVVIPEFVWEFIHGNEVFFPEFKDIGMDVNVDSNDLFKPLTIYELQDGTEQLTHIDMTVRLTNDRGVSHEEVRHRVASLHRKAPDIAITQRISSVLRLHISTLRAVWTMTVKFITFPLKFSNRFMMNGFRRVLMQSVIITA